jgi:mannose-1-phosphate guanylyltransferase
MKAFLLAGGLGTRLRPLTDTTPKCLLPIGGTPLLQLWFVLCRTYGITELLINLHSHGDIVRKFIEENNGGLKITLFEEPQLRGSAGTIFANREWVRNEKAFWILYADVLTTTNLAGMLDFHKSHAQLATIGVYQVPDPSRCGIVQLDKSGVVCDFVEKPQTPVGNLAFSGLMLSAPALLDYIPNEIPADLGFHVLPNLVGKMAAYIINDYLIDVGTLETFKTAQATWPGFPDSRAAV